MLTLNDGRSELWQWDTGRTLAVDADCSQVHFSNKVFGRSIDVDVTDGVAIIPDVLLQTDKDLNVWAFVGASENGYTKISKIFTVNRRNKPADYVFTPTEQTTIDEIAAIAQSVRDDADAGLFNGEPGDNGITPHIGDNGNWYLGATDTGKPSRGATGSKGDTGAIGPTGPVGPQGPAGAPGKDGAGMDITGATVGQIAKIAAVDESGVPTAWSPADMPSGGSPDAVLYTTQTLTDAQKKQARENIDATASDFVINATVASDNTCTTDKTYAQIQEAIQDGKRVTLKVEVYGIDFVLPLIGENSSGYLFTTAATVFPTVTIQFTAVVGASETIWHTEQVASYDSNGNLVQIFMDRDPEQPMEIATKKYVDDHAGGGTDMGITGAAVGQIAKITAVDASGVPTAWEPVDMPSGMSEWQLITDTTIAEEDASTTLFVSQKDSGESFLCHELLIAWIGIAVTDGTQSGKAWISLNPDEAGYNSGECGLMTSAYFYYTSHANYMRTMHVESLPYKVEYLDTGVSTNDSIDAQVIWQNGISSVEVSAYGRKSFYGRVIIYGR